ncbi:antizyme inhibitor 2-like [Ciona intestinalis]
MPQIRRYYAMKCNPSQPVVQLLASLGVGFDCASKFEIESALKCGVKPDDIIFGVPCKMFSHIEYACRSGVRTMTFDNADELHKIKRIHPTGKLLLRLDVTEFEKGIKFGDKFGASMPEARKLILLCKQLDLNLVGICYHPGSGSDSSEATRNCLQKCKKLYDFATSNEVHLKIIDIGGGFICGENFIEVRQLFAWLLIARLLTFILRKKSIYKLCLQENCEVYASNVYGPTGAGVDIVLNNIMLPEAQIGDWWFFDNMGAYSSLVSLGFNGYMVLKTGFYISQDIWNEIADKLDPKSPLFGQYQQLETNGTGNTLDFV